MSRCIILSLCLLLWLSLPQVIWASTINVLTLNEERIGTSSNSNGSINFNFATGDGYAPLRDALLNQTNFGASGSFSRTVNVLPTVSQFLPENLVGADIVLINKPVSLSQQERDAIELFVRQGGSLLAFHNNAAQDWATLLGGTPGAFDSSGQARIATGTSPGNNGPFGALTPGATIGVGFAGSFADLGTGVAAVDNLGVLGATFQLDAGKAAVFADEEIFLSFGVSGIAAGHLNATTTTLFLNTIAHLAPSESFRFEESVVPEPTTLWLFCGGLLLLFRRRSEGGL